MIDPKKLPRLKPQSPAAETPADAPEESLLSQVIGVFSGPKGVLLSCAAAFAIYASVCLQGERLLRSGIYAVLKELGDNGFGISYSAPSSNPAFKSGVNLDDLVITAPAEIGGWTLKAGRIGVSSNPFTPHTVTVKTNGTHSLTTGVVGDIRLVVGRGDVTIRLPSKKNPLTVSAAFKNVQAASPKSMQGFAIDALSLNVRRDGDAAQEKPAPLSFDLETNGLGLPAYMRRNLPANAELLRLTGTVEGLPAETNGKSVWTGWTENSGTIEIKRGEIIWKPFMADFSGTFGFNAAFEPAGAGVAKAYGLFSLLDMLVRDDYVRPSRVSVAKVVLGEKMKRESGESQPSVTTPFSVQSGKIYAGQVLLFDKNDASPNPAP